MKKRFLLSLGLISVFALSGCGLGSSDSEKGKSDGKITVWADDPNFNVPIMKTAVEMYKDGNNDIDVQEVSDLTTKLNTALSSGSKANLPNIVKIEDINAKKFLESYPGSFVKLTDQVEYDDFPSYKTNAVKDENDYYGIPFDSGVAGVFYRNDILEDAGYSFDDINNVTWDEFITIAQDVKEKTGTGIITLSTPISEDANFQTVLMQSIGTWYFDSEGEIDLVDNKKVVAVFDELKKINDSGILSPHSDANERTKALQTGTDFCAVTGSWFTATIKSFEDQSGDWMISSVPRIGLEDGSNYSNHGGSGWYILDSGNEGENDEAVVFLKTMFAGNVDFYDKALNEHAAVTTYLPAQSTSSWKTKDEFFSGEQINSYFSDAMTQVPSVNYGLYTTEVQDIFKNYLKDFYSGKLTTTELLSKVEEDFKNQFQQ